MDGYYKDDVSHKCLPCTVCKKCVGGAALCSSCFIGRFLEGTSCVTTCQGGNCGESSVNECRPCAGPCALCNGSTNTTC